ncbi:hypothetical protein [Nocardiopsis kunsanensis]|uniref:hypothetical protein n=1 Tax=Nocardiopsis kunsanensis TaxID=141693 RepID=UPI001876A4AD|nr:hypothetical protein [Nocardiopsis kunsanensis]
MSESKSESNETGATVVPFPNRRPEIIRTTDIELYEELRRLLPRLGDVYHRDDALCTVAVTTKRGVTKARIRDLSTDALRAFLHNRVDVMAYTKPDKHGNQDTYRDLIPGSITAMLCGDPDKTVPELTGTATHPLVLPTGQIVTTSGYHDETGLYLTPHVSSVAVPDAPTQDQITEAVTLITTVFGDFPWLDSASFAAYIGILMAPAIRWMGGGVSWRVPAPIISANQAGVGKTALCKVFAALYGQHDTTWPAYSNEELEKRLTTAMREAVEPVIMFDNVPNGMTISSTVLAQFLTQETWRARILGTNTGISVPVTKLVVLNGNNIKPHSDMKRRAIPVTLRYEERHPERRDPDGYAVGDLETWLDCPENVKRLMAALLTIIRGWIADGAPRRPVRMASFGSWASATAGLLDWAGIPGFPDSWGDGVSQEDGEWAEFFEMWEQVLSNEEATAREVLMKFPSEMLPPGATTTSGQPSSRKLGAVLSANEGRWIGGHRLVGRVLKGRVLYRLETAEEG